MLSNSAIPLMRLKYQDEIDKLSPCFIQYIEPKNKTAFRWVFEDPRDHKNFLPVYLISPERERTGFEGWALSFFESLQQAKSRHLEITKGKQFLYKKLGTHVAEGILHADDGLCEIQCDNKGHFNHFEYVNVDLSLKFEHVERIAL